jgi:hypothetical protein
MSHLRPLVAAVLAITLSCAIFAAPATAGGGRGGGGGGGGGAGMRGGGGPYFGADAPHSGDGRHVAGGGGKHFGGRPAGPHFAGGAHSRGDDRTRLSAIGGNRSDGRNRNANPRSAVVQRLLNSHAMVSALHDRDALRDPDARARIAAAAIAGHDRNEHGWWRHRHGGYGWAGPLFWPYAYDDLYDYTMSGHGDDPAFWDYGYNDIYTGIFTPYGHDDLTGNLPPSGTTSRTRPALRATADPATPRATAHPATPQADARPITPQANARPATQLATANPVTPQATAHPAMPQAPAHSATNQLTQTCGGDSRDVAGLPIDQIQQAIAPNEAQGAALDDLGNASVKAAQDIRAACPTQIPATAPARLAAMQQRVETMIAAVGTVQPALDKFYGLLNDQQKALLGAVGPSQRTKSAVRRADGALAQNCGAARSGTTDWPTAEIESRLDPTDAQRASLTALVDASAKASNMLKDACLPDDAQTPPARLAATGKRLDVMLIAIRMVLAALDDFYDQLTEEQKAQFEAIGPAGSAASAGEAEAGEQMAAPARQRHRRHRAGLGGGII